MTKLQELMERAAPLPWVAHKNVFYRVHRRPAGEAPRPEDIMDIGHCDISDTPDYKNASDEKKDEMHDLSYANTKLLGHAVNMLPKLVEALEDALKMFEDQERDVDYYICTEALRRRESIEDLLAEANNPEGVE